MGVGWSRIPRFRFDLRVGPRGVWWLLGRDSRSSQLALGLVGV